MTQLTHLELLSPPLFDTKEKLPFSGFYGNSAQEDFLAIYGFLDSAVNLMKESHSKCPAPGDDAVMGPRAMVKLIGMFTLHFF